MESLATTTTTTENRSERGCSEEGRLLQKVFDLVMREKLIFGIHESEKLVDFSHPKDLEKLLHLDVAREGLTWEEAEEVMEHVLKYSVKTQHPYFLKVFYHGIDEVGLASAWLMEALNANQFFYETAPVFALIELFVIEKMSTLFGYEQGDGIFCPGGSASNMYAMALARHRKDPTIKQKGLFGRKPFVAFTSDQSHYSFNKAGNCMGMGQDNIVEVKTDSWGRMLPEALREAVASARAGGGDPFFVNATCGTTVLGGCDPLEELAAICKEEGLWLHADACVGGAAIFSNTYKSFLSGIHRADSISWNAHKMLCVSHQCSLLLTRHTNLLYETNSCQEPYLHQDDKYYDQSYDLAEKSIQCSRKVDAFKLYLTLNFHGLQEVERRVDAAFRAARYVNSQVESRPGFRQVIPEVQCATTCFWFIPPRLRGRPETPEWWLNLDKVAPKIYERMMESGKLMVCYQPIENKSLVNFFRITNHTHPTPLPAHMDFVLDEIERLGADL